MAIRDKNTWTSKELAQEYLEWQRMRHAHPELFGLKSTGLKDLDAIIGGGIELGQLVYIGGAQKSGKTTLLLTVAKAFAKQGLNFIWFGAEMNNLQVGNMLFSNISGIERTKMRRIGLEAADWLILEKAGKEIENFPGYWNYGFSTIKDIDEILDSTEGMDKVQIDAIFVDYIQLMDAPHIKGGRSQEIEFLSRQLKRRSLSRGKPMAVIAAAQLNRESIRGKLVDANAYLGSGDIERSMDIGLIIHPVWDDISNTETPGQKEIVVVGSRETAVGSCRAYYNGSIALLGDPVEPRVSTGNYWT